MPLDLIDAHAHLIPPHFTPAEIDTCVDRARTAGIRGIAVVAECLRDVDVVLETCSRHAPLLRPCLGLHPVQPSIAFAGEQLRTSSTATLARDLPAMLTAIRTHRSSLIAIGEVGLDHSPHHLEREWLEFGVDAETVKREQLRVFAAHIALAVELGLPLNVHSRHAGHHTIKALQEFGARTVLMHAFDGRVQYALDAVRSTSATTFYFSIPPNIVRLAPGDPMRMLAAQLPLDRLLLESDAPALAPERGTRNEPANIMHACRMVAELRGISVEEVAQRTTENAKRLFGNAVNHSW